MNNDRLDNPPPFWEKRRLGDLIDYQKGFAFKSASYRKFGHPIIRVSDFTDRSIDLNRCNKIDSTELGKYKHFELSYNDVVIATVGSWPSNPASVVGKTIRVPYEAKGALLNQNAVRLRAKKEIDQSYLFHLMKDRDFRNYIITGAQGSANQASITLETIFNFTFLLPPLREQVAIASLLNTLDQKIELNQRMNATLESIAQAIFKSWFVDFDPVKAKAEGRKPEGMDDDIAYLFPSTFVESSLGLIPDGWEISEIGKEVEVVGGSTPSTQESAYWEEDGKFYWATPKDLSKLKSPILLDTERKITKLGVKQISSGQLPIDTVLLSSRAPVGYIALAKVPVSINQGFIAMKCTIRLSPYFILNWTFHTLEEIKGRATGTTFAEISKSAFRPIKVIVPSKYIIQEFNNIAKPIYDRIAENEYNISSLTNTRDLLLPRLISGKLRIDEASEIAEAVTS